LQHGESVYNVEGKIGGDSDLSPRGEEYMRALPDLIKKNIGDLPLEVGQIMWDRALAYTGTGLDIDTTADTADWLNVTL
jgi:hypothetical protein